MLLFVACSSDSNDVQQSYPSEEWLNKNAKNGSIFGDNGLQLFGGSKKNQEGGTGIGVNAYLWRAALDAVSFMPIASADPFGGTILTEWHSPGNVTDERLKANIVILDRQLRADSVRVALFRQVKDPKTGNWVDAPVPPAAQRQMEDAILTRARELKVLQDRS
jgi:hypothetical protein